MHRSVRYRQRVDGWSAVDKRRRAPVERDAQRLVAPERATDSKIPGDTVVPLIATRTGWKTSPAWRPSGLHHPAQRALQRGPASMARPRRRAPRAPLASALGPPSPITFSHAFSSAGPSKKAGERPEVGQRLHLLLGDRDRARGDLAADARLEPRAQLRQGQLAQVAAVHPAELLLVEHGRGLRDTRSRANALTSSLGREERVDPRRPSRAARCSCAPPRAGSPARAAPARRRRRGASRASCRRARAAAAGARRPAARRRAPPASAAARGVFERWSSPRTTCVMPMSRSSTATARL